MNNHNFQHVNRSQLRPDSVLFEIGRLLFPELINHGRRMRRRMLLIALTVGLILVATTAGILWKEHRTSRGYAAQLPIK
jgi:hypothetical protein